MALPDNNPLTVPVPDSMVNWDPLKKIWVGNLIYYPVFKTKLCARTNEDASARKRPSPEILLVPPVWVNSIMPVKFIDPPVKLCCVPVVDNDET